MTDFRKRVLRHSLIVTCVSMYVRVCVQIWHVKRFLRKLGRRFSYSNGVFDSLPRIYDIYKEFILKRWLEFFHLIKINNVDSLFVNKIYISILGNLCWCFFYCVKLARKRSVCHMKEKRNYFSLIWLTAKGMRMESIFGTFSLMFNQEMSRMLENTTVFVLSGFHRIGEIRLVFRYWELFKIFFVNKSFESVDIFLMNS